MRLPRARTAGGVGINMTPMIDVVFLLIIFFLLASHLGRQETQVKVDLPGAETGARDRRENHRRVVINVSLEGRILLADREVDLWELERVLKVERKEAGPDLEIRIRSDRLVPYRIVEPILTTCARTGIWKIAFAVQRSQPGKR